MDFSRIAIIGTGRVGATTAYALLLHNCASELLLVDIDKKKCKGELLDLSDALSFSTSSQIQQATYKQAAQADIIIVTAGVAQKPGQSRTELTQKNKEIITSIFNELQPINPDAVIIMVTNPVDLMTYYAQKIITLPKDHVIGTGTFLDSQRLCGALSSKLDIAEQSINAYILGEHGDTQFPAWSSAQAGGVPVLTFENITQKTLDELAQQARDKAYDIINHKGATYYGIAACVASLCESILFNQKRIFPVSCYIHTYDVCLSMPTSIGRAGIERILPIPLTKKEQMLLEESANYLCEQK